MAVRQSTIARPRPIWTLALTSVAFFMVALDALVVITALPAIHRDLGASLSTLEWTVNAYTLAFAAGIVTAAALGDRFGRVRVFVRLHHAGWDSRQILNLWRAADQLGFDGVSVYDIPSKPALECWSLLAYCLGATAHVWGVPLVLSNPVRHPALVAKMARDLNALSGGRVVLGLGAGGDTTDLRAYGLDGMSMKTRLDRLEEALRIVCALFSGESATFNGQHYEVSDLQLADAHLAFA